MISLIVAMARNRVIGKNGQLPWHLPEDLKFFKDTTRGHPIIMGRKTWESLPKALPNRTNIVISRSPAPPNLKDATWVHTWAEAVLAAQGAPGSDEIFVVGGAEIYRLAYPHADRIYLTVIEKDFEGDTRLPEWPAGQFKQVRERAGQGALPHRYLVLEKIR